MLNQNRVKEDRVIAESGVSYNLFNSSIYGLILSLALSKCAVFITFDIGGTMRRNTF